MNTFIMCVVFLLAVVPFLAIWRFPTSLLNKSLCTVIALLFLWLALISVGNSVSVAYHQHHLSLSLSHLSTLLSEQELQQQTADALGTWCASDSESTGKLYEILKSVRKASED